MLSLCVHPPSPRPPLFPRFARFHVVAGGFGTDTEVTSVVFCPGNEHLVFTAVGKVGVVFFLWALGVGGSGVVDIDVNWR